MKKFEIVLVFMAFVVVGCGATRTAIRTEPPGATVMIGEKQKIIGTTPMYIDLDNELGFGQTLGLGTSELVMKFRLDGYEEDVSAIQKGGGSLLEEARWPSDVFIRLREKKKK